MSVVAVPMSNYDEFYIRIRILHIMSLHERLFQSSLDERIKLERFTRVISNIAHIGMSAYTVFILLTCVIGAVDNYSILIFLSQLSVIALQ